MRAKSALVLALSFPTLGVVAGCNNPVYLQQNRPLEAMMQATTMDTGLLSDTDLYVLPVRRPTTDEAMKLAEEQAKLALPMPVPWVGERDVDIEIEWTMKNLETKEIQARVSVNGGNEFGDYDKTLFVDLTAPPEDQTPPPDLLGGGKLTTMAAGEVRMGVFREDELREAGLDLEAITRYPPPDAGINVPFMVLVRHSSASRVGLEAIPAADVIPAMVRMSFLLESTGRVVFDYVVRVRENGDPRDKLAAPDAPDLYVSTAATLAAPAQPMQPMFN
jgi:hypothetical protein